MADLWLETDFGTKKPGLLIEVPVSPEAGPFLVSGTRGWVWVNSAKGGFVRAAVRGGSSAGLEGDLVQAVAREGTQREWGNAFPCTPVGVASAKAYLSYYDINEVEVLVGAGSGVEGSHRDWVPDRCAILVPKDRSYLGMLGRFGERWSVVIHNPSRGLVVLGAW